MNEYNDAIQRLEISERPPGTTIRRSIFPIPRKNTLWNYNYVFRNTGNMNIPKYSIPQTLIIVNYNQDWIDARTTELNTLIANSKTALSTAEETLDSAEATYNEALEKLLSLQETVRQAQETLEQAEQAYHDNPDDDDLYNAFYEATLTYNEAVDALEEYAEGDYATADNKLAIAESEIVKLTNQIENYESELKNLGYSGISVFDFLLDEQFTLAQGNRKSIAIRAINLEPVPYTCGQETKTDDVQFVACSINPWSKNNIIGNISQTIQSMPFMFPWNGQQHITIWFLNSLGQNIKVPCIKGSIELELIIDNENTYAYE